MMIQRLSVILLIFLTKCNGILYRNHIIVDSLSKSVIKVIKDVGKNEHFLTCISITTDNSSESYYQHSDIINHIAHNVTNAISIISFTDRHSTFEIAKFKERKRFNVFVVDGLNGFRILSNQIRKGNFYFDGKFLFVINNSTSGYINLIEEICLSFFYQYITNVNILIPNPFVYKQILMFTYYPYKPERCSRSNIELYNVFSDENFVERKQHFPDKLQNFFNCSVSVAAFNTTPYVKLVEGKNGNWQMHGIEGKLFSKVAEYLNFNIRVHSPDGKWGVIYPNNTFTGAFAMLHQNIVNVTVGSFFYQSKATELFDLTWSYHTTYLCFFIPSGRPFTSLEKTLWPFQSQVWYTLLLVMLLKSILQILIKTLPQNRFLDNIDILDVTRIYFGLSIPKYPTKILSKIFIVSMFFSSLILRSCYQSSLFHLFTVIINMTTVNSMNEMIQKDFQFFMINALHFVLESVPQISSRTTIIVNEDLSDVLKDVNWDSKIALLSSRAYIIDELIPIKENIYQLAIAMVLQKNSYFTGVFNDVIYKLLANGYVSKLYNDLGKRKRIERPSKTGLLCMENVIGLFGICLFGYVLAFVIFILETLSKVFKRKFTSRTINVIKKDDSFKLKF